jgi:preprotein translocase SecF subunit
MGLSLVPDDTHIPFTKAAPIAQVVSLLAIVGSVVALFVMGLNFGIDFRGGTEIEVGPAEGQSFTTSDLEAVRSALGGLGLGEVGVKTIGGGPGGQEQGIVVSVEAQAAGDVPVAAETGPLGAAEGGAEVSPERAAELAQQRTAERVQGVLAETLGEGISFRRVDVVGPTVSGELVERGIEALVIALVLMLVYIWFAFSQWQFSVGAVAALVHDVTLTIGVFAVTQLDFTLSIIAALLTIVGYSMNDTVVVFDRVRENLRRFKRKPLDEVLDLSLNQTLSRTLMTSGTTILALLALFLFGGQVLRGFSFALIWGILVGTYSSIFIASPILLRTGLSREAPGEEGVVQTA